MFFLFSLIASIVLLIIDKITGTYSAHSGVGLLGGLYGLATLIPGLAVTVRRLHDTGRSGWWILICLIPFIGAIIFIVFLASNGNAAENKYGGDPKLEPEPQAA